MLMWLANHSPEILLGIVVMAATIGWVWLLAKESEAQDERDEEMARRMVDLCESYNYRSNTFE